MAPRNAVRSSKKGMRLAIKYVSASTPLATNMNTMVPRDEAKSRDDDGAT